MAAINLRPMKREWLQKKLETTDYVSLATEELLSLGLVDKKAERELLDRLANEPPPERWKEFIRTMQQDDELWYYKSPKETWDGFRGAAGYAIVRKGEVIASFNTMKS
jgi:sugar/nucleoside kinase (ribokinase family)